MTILTRKLLGTALVSAFCVGIASPPAFADGYDVATSIVKFSDLDVTHRDGATKLYGRIRTAAAAVCVRFEGIDPERRLQKLRCVDEAVSNAVAKIGNPLLSDIYSERTGKEVAARLVSR